jgi:hypothetical protein
MPTTTEHDHADKIIKYEAGEMTPQEQIEFFQELINSGMAWKLQGHYGKLAHAMILEGLCKHKGE